MKPTYFASIFPTPLISELFLETILELFLELIERQVELSTSSGIFIVECL